MIPVLCWIIGHRWRTVGSVDTGRFLLVGRCRRCQLWKTTDNTGRVVYSERSPY